MKQRGRPKKEDAKQNFLVRLKPKTIEYYRANRGLASKVLEEYKQNNEDLI